MWSTNYQAHKVSVLSYYCCSFVVQEKICKVKVKDVNTINKSWSIQVENEPKKISVHRHCVIPFISLLDLWLLSRWGFTSASNLVHQVSQPVVGMFCNWWRTESFSEVNFALFFISKVSRFSRSWSIDTSLSFVIKFNDKVINPSIIGCLTTVAGSTALFLSSSATLGAGERLAVLLLHVLRVQI